MRHYHSLRNAGVHPDGNRLSALLAKGDATKTRTYRPICDAYGYEFMPVGLTAWGAMTQGTLRLLVMVAHADGQGYVGEVWGTLKGDKIRATQCLYRGLSHAVGKGVATQLVLAQQAAKTKALRISGCARRLVASWGF